MYTRNLFFSICFLITSVLHSQIVETFYTFNELGSYTNGSFTGSDSIVWNYVYCKGGQEITEDNKAICLGKADSAMLISSIISDTCAGVSFYYKQEYSTPVSAFVCINSDTISLLHTSIEDSICYFLIETAMVPPFTFSIHQAEGSGQVTIDDISFQTNEYEKIELSRLQFGDCIITEIMADPIPAVNQELCEFIEIYNRTDSALTVSNFEIWVNNYVAIVDTFKIEKDEYIAIGEEGCPDPIIGIEKFPTIANSGALIRLVSNGATIHEVEFSPNMHSSVLFQDGGWSLEMFSIDNYCITEENWSTSLNRNGATPGFENSNIENIDIKPQLLEYYMESDSVLKIEFSHIFNVEQIALSIEREKLVDIHYDENLHTCVVYLPQNLQSDSKYTVCYSLHTCNNYKIEDCFIVAVPDSPNVNDITITELLFDELYDNTQFIEIMNVSQKTIDLNNLYLATFENEAIKNYEKLSARHFLLCPDEVVAIAIDKKALLEWYYGIDSAIIENPDQQTFPNSDATLGIITKQGNKICSILYSDDMHSNLLDDTKGTSLILNNNGTYASESEQAGYASPGYIQNEEEKSSRFTVEVSKRFHPEKEEFARIEIHNNHSEGILSVYVFDIMGNLIKTIDEEFYLHTNATLHWDGTNNDGQLVKGANYIVKVTLVDSNGRRYVRKRVCAKM